MAPKKAEDEQENEVYRRWDEVIRVGNELLQRASQLSRHIKDKVRMLLGGEPREQVENRHFP